MGRVPQEALHKVIVGMMLNNIGHMVRDSFPSLSLWDGPFDYTNEKFLAGCYWAFNTSVTLCNLPKRGEQASGSEHWVGKVNEP
jgi:hypothetical protein